MTSTFGRLLCVVWLLLGSVVGSAQKTTPAMEREANEFFVKGKLLFKAGKYHDAVQAFQLAYDIAPKQVVLINIANCYWHIQNYPKAVSTLRRYLAAPVAGLDNQRIARELTKWTRYVADVEVRCVQREVSLSDGSCQLSIDGVKYGSAPLTAVLSPGEHELVAHWQGQRAKQRIAVAAGEKTELALSFATSPVTAPAEPDAVTDAPSAATVADASSEDGLRAGSTGGTSPVPLHRARSLRVPFWTFASLTVASGIAAIGFGVATQKTHDAFVAGDRRSVSLQQEGQRQKLLTNVMLGGCIVSAATTTVLGVLHLRHNRRRPSGQRVTAARWSLAPEWEPHLAGVRLVGRF